jgi:hypothetical protein
LAARLRRAGGRRPRSEPFPAERFALTAAFRAGFDFGFGLRFALAFARAGAAPRVGRSSAAIALPSSAGDFTVRTPAASSARYLFAAVP